MSTQQNPMPWYKAFDQAERPDQNRNNQHRNDLSAIIAQAEASFESGEHQELIGLIEARLTGGVADLEQEVLLRCLLNEALTELSRYEDAAAVLACYENHPLSLSNKLKAELLLRIGATLSWQAQYPRAIAKLNEAVLIFTILSDREGISRGYFELSRLYININEYTIARDYLTRALSEAELFANRRLTAQIMLRLGMVSHYEGDFANAKSSYRRALKLIEGSRDFRLLGSLQMDLANTLFLEERGSADQIISLYESAIENFKLLNNHHFIAHCFNNLGDCLLRFGMWERAQQFLNEALELARASNYSHSEGLALITLSELNLRRGDAPAAKRLITAAIKIVEQTDKSALAYARRVLGYTYQPGNPAALKAFNSSLQLATAVGDHNEISFTQLALSEYYYAREDYEQSLGFLNQVHERLSHKLSPYISGFAQRLTGLLKAAEGAHNEAVQHITSSISIFTTVGDRYELGRSHLELAGVLARCENFENGRAHILPAREIFWELEARPYITRAQTVMELIEQPLKASTSSIAIKPTAEAVSDLALVKRLAQTGVSSEILLEEFLAIINELLQPRRTLIFQLSNDVQALLLTHGYGREEAQQQRARLEAQLNKGNQRLASNSRLFKLTGNNFNDIYLYLELPERTNPQYHLDRLQLLLEYLKLALDNCALRANQHPHAIVSVAAGSNHEPQTLIQGFVYSSPTMRRVVDQIKKIRTSDVTVLITGESGTGKELVARAIHAESVRREGAFVAFNCTATPRELIESQLFGHRRGSFTGATSNYLGVIRTAKGGTLFLDEIGDLSLDLQPKLLRFLEAGEIQPLGEGRPLKVDVRVIAATNAELSHAVAERRFREDLYHRLNIIRIHIPPLRERAEEIPMLLRYYLDYFSARYGDKKIVFSESAITALQHYHWPGNVRQLRNELERLITYSGKGDLISAADLSLDIRHEVAPAPVVVPMSRPAAPAGEPVKVIDMFKSSSRKLRDVVRPIERELILATLERNRGNFSRTAQELGMSRRGLRLKIESLGINIAGLED